ncbi:MAG TPA: hypothetical protein VL443_11725 [Cyclobacteriaceae bacterium]|jgi:hypothetical protein|nr:hypothetical protein [Cyclobacteriaceae bacterium]
MKKITTSISAYTLAFTIALVYVGFGTIAVCSVYPSDPFYDSWSEWWLLITFPVIVVSFGYRYAEAHILWPVFIIQFIMFVSVFLALSSLLKKKKISKWMN